MSFMGGGNQDNPTAEPRKARRELDKQTSEKLHALLRDDQKARLPKEEKRNQMEDAMDMMGMDIDPELAGDWEQFGEGGE
jgi:hypothetical protein